MSDIAELICPEITRPLGTRYVNGALIIDENAIESDRVIPGDKRTMDIIKLIGNDVHPSIQLEVDCLSNMMMARYRFWT